MLECTDNPAGTLSSRWSMPIHGGTVHGEMAFPRGASTLRLVVAAIGILVVFPATAAWGHPSPTLAQISAEDGSNLCAVTRPGMLRSWLLCPGGYPITTPWLLWPGVGLLALGTGAAVIGRRRATRHDESLPYLIFQPAPAALEPSLEPAGRATQHDPLARATRDLPPPTLYASALDNLAHPGAAVEYRASPSQAAPPPPTADEATVQLLPGRLKILSGYDQKREFRFIRSQGRETEVTIGRNNDQGAHHVQLAAPTVSRLHARMRFAGGGWTIENLSQTNPLVINGQILAEGLPARLLQDEDRLEIGEFVLLYHDY